VGAMSFQKGGPIVPGGPTPHYPPEFKLETVKLYHSSGKSIPKMAEELGIASKSLRRWISQHEVDAGEREGLTADEREEDSPQRRVPAVSEKGLPKLRKSAVSSPGAGRRPVARWCGEQRPRSGEPVSRSSAGRSGRLQTSLDHVQQAVPDILRLCPVEAA